LRPNLIPAARARPLPSITAFAQSMLRPQEEFYRGWNCLLSGGSSGMSTHEGHISDIGRLVRVESGDLRFHPLAAVAALSAACVSSDLWRFRAGRASPGDAAGGFGRPIWSTTQTAVLGKVNRFWQNMCQISKAWTKIGPIWEHFGFSAMPPGEVLRARRANWAEDSRSTCASAAPTRRFDPAAGLGIHCGLVSRISHRNDSS